MDDKNIIEIKTILQSIILQNQSNNIFDSNLVNELKFENKTVYFHSNFCPNS